MILNKESIKEFPNLSGIYKITSPTNKVYIGEASNLYSRCKSYTNPNKIKRQTAIYNSIIKHGVNRHMIEIIEFCDISDLKTRERYWQEYFNSVEGGLNCFYTSTSDKKKVHSKKTLELMSENQKGEKNSFFSKKHSIESLEKISDASSGKNNPNFGGKFKNEDWLLKQSVSNSKKHLKVIDTETNLEFIFINSKECAKTLGVKESNVRMCKNTYKLKRRYIVTDL